MITLFLSQNDFWAIATPLICCSGVAFWWNNTPRIEIAVRFLLSIVSVIFVFGLLELLALTKIVDFRLVLGTPMDPWEHPDNLLDTKLLHIHRPHLLVRWGDIEYQYDQYGFRNESDLETLDIVVIGDSMIEGWNVSAADLMTAQLAKQMHRSVANLGQSWYGPQQELEVLQRYGLTLHPKTVVWVFFEGNDLYDWYRYKNATRDWANFSKQFHSFRRRSFTRNSVHAVRRLVDAALQQKMTGLFKESSGRLTRLHFWDAGHYLSEADLRALEEMRSAFREAYRLCRANGARFLVVFVPTNFRVYKAFMQFDPKAQRLNWVINDLPRDLR